MVLINSFQLVHNESGENLHRFCLLLVILVEVLVLLAGLDLLILLDEAHALRTSPPLLLHFPSNKLLPIRPIFVLKPILHLCNEFLDRLNIKNKTWD